MKRIKMVLMEFKVHHDFFNMPQLPLFTQLLNNRESYLVIDIEEEEEIVYCKKQREKNSRKFSTSLTWEPSSYMKESDSESICNIIK